MGRTETTKSVGEGMMEEPTKEDFRALRVEVERAMVVLRKLQIIHREYTGREHVMPIYLDVPMHLKDVV